MGVNKEIKHYQYHHPGENLELFATRGGKTFVANEILKSRWVMTAGKLKEAKTSSAAVGKFYDQSIAVLWNSHARRPVKFFWRRKFYRVEEVIGTWVLENHWWDRAKKQSRLYFRVLAAGGTYDIYLDLLKDAWFLESVND